jgi:3'(2'), 5'-bisphosphate nucleotidase
MRFRGNLPVPEHVLQGLLELTSKASSLILEHYRDYGERVPSTGDDRPVDREHWQHREKVDRTPLTEADLDSHRLLMAGLGELLPGVPVLSEECSDDELAERRGWDRFWMVDPLDGTREFLERSGEFTINVALIEAQRPVIGLIHQPIAARLCLGVVGAGAWQLHRQGDGWVSQDLHTRPLPESLLVLLASRRHRNGRLAASIEFLASEREVQRRNSGSALKFCDLAAGLGDCYPRFSLCSEWDVAAGDALVSAAGGSVFTLDGSPLRYNARDTLLSPHFIAVGDPGNSLWSRLLEALS